MSVMSGNNKGILAGAFCGALFFLLVFGWRIVNPLNVQWLLSINWDHAEHYLGWYAFSREPWMFPPGRITLLNAPIGTSIGITDSLPFAAFALKPLSRFLNVEFQYFGLWFITCFALQGVFASILLQKAFKNPVERFLAAAFFITSPVLLYRLPQGHEALCGQWTILAALWLYFESRKGAGKTFPFAGWSALILFLGVLHPYLCAMVVGVYAASLVGRWMDAGGEFYRTAARRGAILFAALFALWYLVGYFETGSMRGLLGYEFGYYSMNLLSPVNPLHYSVLYEGWPVGPGQGEGFGYIGAGMMALIAVSVFIAVKRPPSVSIIRRHLPLLVLCVLLTAFAISTNVMVGEKTVISINHRVLNVFSVFRATGRFFWPVYYLIFFSTLVFLSRRVSRKWLTVILLVALILQIVDISKMFNMAASYRSGGRYENPLNSELWNSIDRNCADIILVPPDISGSPWLPFTHWAVGKGKSTNVFYVGRNNYAVLAANNKALLKEVVEGRFDPKALYVLDAKYAAVMKESAGDAVQCQVIDGFRVCVNKGGCAP
jgi:hypothetical protein